MKIDFDVSLDLTSIPSNGDPDLFYVINPVNGDGEIIDTKEINLFHSVWDAIACYTDLNGNFSSHEDAKDMLQIVIYLETLAGTARAAFDASY